MAIISYLGKCIIKKPIMNILRATYLIVTYIVSTALHVATPFSQSINLPIRHFKYAAAINIRKR